MKNRFTVSRTGETGILCCGFRDQKGNSSLVCEQSMAPFESLVRPSSEGDAEAMDRFAVMIQGSAGCGPHSQPRITLLGKTYSRHSEVSTYRIETSSGLKYVVAKRICDPNPRTPQSFHTEYSALEKIRQLAGASLVDSFPDPLFVSQEQIVLSMVPGAPLDKKLKQTANALTGWFSIKRMRNTGRQIAEWLGRFHELTRCEDIGHEHGKYAAQLESLIAKCETLGVAGPGLRRVGDATLQLSRALASYSMPAAANHGDFIPQNILFHNGKLGVIDFASYSERASVYQDIAHFVGYLVLLGGKPTYCKKPLDVLASTFLASYPLSLNERLLRPYLIRAVLRLICDGKPASNYLRRVQNRNVSGWLLRLADVHERLPFSI